MISFVTNLLIGNFSQTEDQVEKISCGGEYENKLIPTTQK